MKKPELDSILKKARLPEISMADLEKFPSEVADRIQRERSSWSSNFSLPGGAAAGNTLKRERQRLLPRLAWTFSLAACVVIAFAIGHWSGRMETKATAENDSLANIKLIRETLALFPNRVRAIVQDERGLNLVLSDQENVRASTPIYVRICDGNRCSSLVTFSGQEIQIGGQKLTVLSQPDGGIILEGNKFVWSSNEPVYAGRKLKIEAKNLGTITM
jgi:hypothetical protein